MACTDTFATYQEFNHFWCISDSDGEAEELVEACLEAAAGNVHASLAAANACSCTLAGWADAFLKKLNLLEAGVLVNCRCGTPRLTEESKRMYLEWVDRQLELVRTGKVDVCADATGADWPSVGWAAHALTERAAAEIIANDMQRNA